MSTRFTMQPVKHIRSLHQYLQRLLTTFIVIWLAVFYSAVCEYHGLMLPLGTARINEQIYSNYVAMCAHQAEQAVQPSTPRQTSPAIALDGLMQGANQDNGGLQRGRMALNTVAMSLLIMAPPMRRAFPFVKQQSSRIVVDTVATHQCAVAPPDQPPRLLSSR